MDPSQIQLLETLAAALSNVNKEAGGQHTKAPANYNTAGLLTQPGGMFTVTGIEQNVISTHVAPHGLGAMLPALPSDIDDPRFGFITGFGADIGSEAVEPCDDAPTGYMKSGLLTATFGRLMRDTDTIEMTQLLHKKRGASADLRLMGAVLGRDVGMDIGSMNTGSIMDMVVESEMVNVGVSFERLFSKLLWQGAITNNTAGGGYKEFPGLDSQIATGQVDAETNTAMPAADSLIFNFGYNDVDGTTLDIVEYLSMMEYYMYDLAQRTQLAPATWAFVMRRDLWHELSAVWPCRYLTDRCGVNDGTNPMVINDDTNVRMRDEMRNGMFIVVNGRRYPVIVDDGIYEYNSTNSASVGAGEFASSIYLVPLRVRGSMPVTYWEYIDYRQIQAQLRGLGTGASKVPFWTDNGRYVWVYKENGLCFNLQAVVEPRVILRTPHLASRLDYVKYSPLEHLRDSDPASDYWKDGGVSMRSKSTNYAVWGNFMA